MGGALKGIVFCIALLAFSVVWTLIIVWLESLIGPIGAISGVGVPLLIAFGWMGYQGMFD